jgi:hypothetical protein
MGPPRLHGCNVLLPCRFQSGLSELPRATAFSALLNATVTVTPESAQAGWLSTVPVRMSHGGWCRVSEPGIYAQMTGIRHACFISQECEGFVSILASVWIPTSKYLILVQHSALSTRLACLESTGSQLASCKMREDRQSPPVPIIYYPKMIKDSVWKRMELELDKKRQS